MRNTISFIFLLILFSSLAFAADEIFQHADRLNYWNSETHTVTIINNGNLSTQVNLTIPSGFSWNSGTCANPSSGLIVCNLDPAASKTYQVISSGSNSEYELSVFSPTTNNSYTGNDVSFIKIRDDEIFHTLVEYGRGRGNYFYDTYGSGQYAGSGHTGTGCPYVPDGTLFELNYLHKVNNVKHYFGDLTASAYNATFSCTYPNNTIVRQHLITSIITNSSGAFVSYLISKIDGSWERIGYLGMNFYEGDYALGSNITINCTNLTYSFPVGGGNFVVPEDSFTFQFRSREPFAASASTLSTIGNGTQEVLILYNITNTEIYTVDDVVIEINAPPYATFIGTRGELWGTALSQYRIEKAQLSPGESEMLILAARFDTSAAPNLSAVNLTSGIKIKYITCWELNAYNPGAYTQVLTGIGAGAVNMGVPANITSVIDQLKLVINISTLINSTIADINNTVNNINSIVSYINSTVHDTNIIVTQINDTANTILNNTNIIVDNTNIILNDTAYIIDLLNCNGTVDTPLCNKTQLINQSLWELYNFSLYLNYTANNLNVSIINYNISGINVTVNIDWTNLTNQLTEVKELINCSGNHSNDSVCGRIEQIEEFTLVINSSIENLNNITNYFNTTVFGNYTFQDILDAINSTTVDTSEVLTALKEMREFNEEAIFLITDSFNLQQSAQADLSRGDLVSAVDNLVNANSRLQQAAEQLSSGEQNISGASSNSSLFSVTWVWVALIMILVFGGIFYYLFAKVPPGNKGNGSAGMLKIIPLFAFLLIISGMAFAAWGPLGTIVQVSDDLNYQAGTKNMTVHVYYNCTGTRTFNITFPAGFTLLNTGSPCGLINSQLASCSFSSSSPFNYGWYHFSGPANISDREVINLATWLSNTTDCSISNNISVIKIPNDEIFYTLVEYGRGRGNYFYSTKSGSAGSGHTGIGCPYIPNGTVFELNFLHKVFNIKQYFNEPFALAKNATFTCSYPDRTIVRSHLGTTITQGAGQTNISYFIDEIGGSWERMSYVGMQFDASEQYVGQNLTISCSDVNYHLAEAGGNVRVPASSTAFTLQVRDPYPFAASASTLSTIGNGTQEVLILYNITNTELYTIDDVVIEINAPPYATFIGTRGELWGTALSQYRIEKAQLSPGESEMLILAARFDTSAAPNLSAVNLTSGIKIKYITCWELNAYNPGAYTQVLTGIGAGAVNMGVPASVIGVRESLEMIINILTQINTTSININSTVNNIESVINEINSTTYSTNIIVQQINSTLNNISNNVDLAINNTNLIINDTSYIKDLLNCNGTIDTPMCSWMDEINSTIINISSVFHEINATLSNITLVVDLNLSDQNLSYNITPDLTNITLIIEDIYAELNCSMNWTTEPNSSLCWSLVRIENNTILINDSINNINNLLEYFNTTVFANITIEDIINAMSNITVETSALLEEIRKMKEFDQEMIFLVTDAFGMQQAAKEDLDRGDLGAAAEKLRQANERLNTAALKLRESQEEAEQEIKREEDMGFSWVIYMVGLIGISGLLFYLFSKPKVHKFD